MAWRDVRRRELHTSRCASSLPWRASEAQASPPNVVLSTSRWRLPASWSGRHASPREGGASLRGRTRLPEYSGLCPGACLLLPGASFLSPACALPSRSGFEAIDVPLMEFGLQVQRAYARCPSKLVGEYRRERKAPLSAGLL